ncbi:hypothetical protein JD82_00372 [Prauserella rugosa]|uniref:Uncharacterized protein n=1 Tax=Prauserella rugosa TaxID=43354 RepID=A0A660C9Y9_9PSEU|nr:hypothetical protein JD82_00372 [Prauserella rugosa]
MTTVVGLDLSLTNAGCAVITTDGTDYSVESWVKLSKGRRGGGHVAGPLGPPVQYPHGRGGVRRRC